MDRPCEQSHAADNGCREQHGADKQQFVDHKARQVAEPTLLAGAKPDALIGE